MIRPAALLLALALPAASADDVSDASAGASSDVPAPEAAQPPSTSPDGAGSTTVPPISTGVPGPQLLVEDLRVGAGAEAVIGSTVAVHYTGWLEDKQAPGHKGRQFDSSRGRNPLVIPLGAGRVIKGWDLGLPGMKVGGARRLTIPPELGYGSRAVGGGVIPGNSTLIFEVELLGVESVRDIRGER